MRNSTAPAVKISRALLEEIVEGLQHALCNQMSLIKLTGPIIAGDPLAAEALVISIDRFNGDAYNQYERLQDLLGDEAEAQS